MKSIITLMIVFVMTILAQDANYPADLKKALEVVKKDKYAIDTQLSLSEAFCTEMLEDFKSGNGFEYIEPDIQTDDYNNSALMDATKECRKKYPYINIVMVPPDLYLQKHIYASDRYTEYARKNAWMSHWGYRWYELDFDGNASNGKENLFYQSGYILMVKDKKRPSRNYYEYDEIRLYSKNQCKPMFGLQVSSLYNEKKERTRYLNGVVKYKNKYYIYELNDYGDPSDKVSYMRIKLRGWSAENVKRGVSPISPTCSYKKLKFKTTRKK